MPGGSVFARLLVMGTFWKIFFGRDEKMARFARKLAARGSLHSQFALLARCARKTLRSRPSPSSPYKEKAPAMKGDRGRCWGTMGEMPVFILEVFKRIGARLAKTLTIFLRNWVGLWETI